MGDLLKGVHLLPQQEYEDALAENKIDDDVIYVTPEDFSALARDQVRRIDKNEADISVNKQNIEQQGFLIQELKTATTNNASQIVDVNNTITEIIVRDTTQDSRLDAIESKYADKNNVVTLTDQQTISGPKTFVEHIYIVNADGTVDRISHLNNNFIIHSGATNAAVLNIDEGLSKIYAFNKELAFKSDVLDASGTLVKVGGVAVEELSFTSDPQEQIDVVLASVPTKVSQLTNDSNYETTVSVDSKISAVSEEIQRAIDGLGTVFDLKGVKASVSDLPTTGNSIGDVWYVTAEEVGYIWLNDGTTDRWERFGAPIDLSGYAPLTELNKYVLKAGDSVGSLTLSAAGKGITFKTKDGVEYFVYGDGATSRIYLQLKGSDGAYQYYPLIDENGKLYSGKNEVLTTAGGTMNGTLSNAYGIVVGKDSSSANNTKGIIFGENGLTRIGASSSLGLYAERNIYFRPGIDTDDTAGLAMTRTAFYPTTDKSMSLGGTSNYFNNIYGTKIYQDGKQVANKEDLRTYQSLIPAGSSIPAGADLNSISYLKVGNHYCQYSSDAKTLLNCPTQVAFLMVVYSPLSTALDTEQTGAWVYRVRKILTFQGDEYVQYAYTNGTAGEYTYGAWKQILTTNNISTDTAQFTNKLYEKSKNLMVLPTSNYADFSAELNKTKPMCWNSHFYVTPTKLTKAGYSAYTSLTKVSSEIVIKASNVVNATMRVKNLRPNTTYTFSGNITHCYQPIMFFGQTFNSSMVGTVLQITFTTDANGEYVLETTGMQGLGTTQVGSSSSGYYNLAAGEIWLTDVQLEEGSTRTSYAARDLENIVHQFDLDRQISPQSRYFYNELHEKSSGNLFDLFYNGSDTFNTETRLSHYLKINNTSSYASVMNVSTTTSSDGFIYHFESTATNGVSRNITFTNLKPLTKYRLSFTVDSKGSYNASFLGLPASGTSLSVGNYDTSFITDENGEYFITGGIGLANKNTLTVSHVQLIEYDLYTEYKPFTGNVLCKGDLYPETITLGKTQRTAHDTVVDYWIASDGKTWYRKWASGWKECGGTVETQASNDSQTITFPQKFESTAVFVTMTKGVLGTATALIGDIGAANVTQNSFQTRGYNGPVRYYACGF